MMRSRRGVRLVDKGQDLPWRQSTKTSQATWKQRLTCHPLECPVNETILCTWEMLELWLAVIFIHTLSDRMDYDHNHDDAGQPSMELVERGKVPAREPDEHIISQGKRPHQG